MPLFGELLMQLLKVRNYTVMHHGDFPGAVAVRVGVCPGRSSMGRPSRMPDTDFPFEAARQFLFQSSHPDRILMHLQFTTGHRNTAGVIAAVFQPGQAVQQDGLCLPFPDVTNDAAHLVRYLL